MLTEKDIQQLGKSYSGQAPSSDVHYIVEQAFRELQSRWRYADNDAKKSEMEVDFTKLQELKGNVKSLNADAQYELFMLASSNDMSTFRFALDKVVLSYIRSFGKILARNDVARGGWDGKQYATQSIANDPVYQEFYTLLPKLSSEERAKLSGLREDLKLLGHGSVQSSFFGALGAITSFSGLYRQEQLDFFLDGDALRYERQYKQHLSLEARGNLFFVLSCLGGNERQSLLQIAPDVASLRNRSDQAHFLRSLWSVSSPENQSFFLDGQAGAIDYMTRYRPFLPSQRA